MNNNDPHGYKSATFAAIWSMFLVITFTGIAGSVVFGGKASELLVGFLIGVAAMLTELFFVLMVIFFIIGQSAGNNNYSTFFSFMSSSEAFLLVTFSFSSFLRGCRCR